MLFVGLLFRCFGEEKEDLNCQFCFINLFSVFIIGKKRVLNIICISVNYLTLSFHLHKIR